MMMSRQHFDDYLLYQLAIASQALSSQFHKELAKQGVSPAAWRILYCLWSKPDMRLTELARHVLYKQPRVTKCVAQLKEDGLVEKNIRSEDRRNVSLHLTENGKKLVMPLIKRSREHEDKVLAALSEKDRLQFRRSLTLLIQNMDVCEG